MLQAICIVTRLGLCERYTLGGAQDMTGSISGTFSALQWLQLVEHELLLFAAFWFVVGLVDEFAIDLSYIVLKLSKGARTAHLPTGYGAAPLAGRAAVLIPTWQEAPVIATTLAHALGAWPQAGLRIYVGCYRNDAATIAAAITGAGNDSRVRLVIHDRIGPTTKADCLNRLYAALSKDEARSGEEFRSVVLHDAEDMVHPAALAAIDTALFAVDFVQLPVRPELQPGSRWIAGHYADEFAEAHAKLLVVRDAIGAALPAAGVGCGFARRALADLAARRMAEGEVGPFAAECLTEDYELGLLISQHGRRSSFLRLRDASGQLVATRSFFPTDLGQAVRQKTRWVHGIAFQSWDRMGWTGGPVDLWMALRDRRGPLTALVLAAAYLLLIIDAVLLGAHWAGLVPAYAPSGVLKFFLLLSFFGFVWRALMRFTFTAHEYGLAEGIWAVARIPVSNIIAIMAGRRAFAAYFRTLRGGAVIWDKTAHLGHPARSAAREVTA